MPTVRGWAALGAALALGLLWIAFGERLLLAVSAFLALSVVFGVVYVRRSVPRVSLRRIVSPPQIHDGDRAIVELELTVRRRVHQVKVEDVVRGLGAARFTAHRVEADRPTVARYEVLARPRGVYRVGPVSVTVGDALDMAEAGGAVGRADRLVVYPSVEDLVGLPIVRGQDPTVNTSRSNFSPTGGDDFFTLREYQQGDDLRHVHWPSSARRDDLMIKQLEMPWQSRALVLLNPRQSSYAAADAFEHAVRGAASTVRHLFKAGYNPTLFAASGRPTTVTSPEAYATAMEALAVVATQTGVSLPVAVRRLARGGLSGGAFVLVTGAIDEQDLEAYRALSRDYLRSVVMSVTRAETDTTMTLRRVGAITIQARPGEAWAPAWREAMRQSWSTATAG